MMLIEETQVPDAALPVAAFREHLRLGSGFADDSLQDGVLASFLRAALAAIEARTGKALLERSFALTVQAWHGPERQPLPLAPISAVGEVVLVDGDGGETLVAPSAYRLLPDPWRPVLYAVGAHLPRIGAEGHAVVCFVAGYGPDWNDLPPDLCQAVLLLAAHYYEHRNETTLGSGCAPFGVTSLIERYRPMRMTLGEGQ
ncbi:phage conserved hypothetical protein, phiE125 gp8 family [Salinihabitans flavidus]|uniref:Phage gp6-like head-tail connector protein n=1 Tax=Salinihabitans flavidus TaxID=569882 RepID=A0A1H8Q8Q8_9RHOB|nr:head-tail connector protein [Salinihabitans flavidus]SEO50622.1 phage conserved hypothetical protein, phiE125 gp8 family [Salinihabitans flavidus]